MRSSVPMGTDGSIERSQREAESKVNEEQEPRGNPSSSSSDGRNRIRPNNVNSFQAGPLLLQGHQVVFQIGETSPPNHSQQAMNVALANFAPTGTSVVHFPPTAVEPSNQQAIISLNPEHMSLFHPIINTPPAQNLSVFGDQQIVPSQIANHAERSPPSNPMGTENQGYIVLHANEVIQHFGNAYGAISPYHLPLSTLPPEHRLDSSSSAQLPQIQQQGPQTTPNSANSGGFSRPEWANWPPQSQTAMHNPPTATGSQEIQFQGLMNQDGSGMSSNFYPGADSSSHASIPNMPIQPEMSPYGASGSSLIFPHSFEGVPPPIVNNSKKGNQGNIVNYGQFEAGDLSQRTPKWKMAGKSHVNNNLPPAPGYLPLGNWFSQGQSTRNAQTSRPVPIKNKCYDPLYEEMGLPVDPHLRMFLAKRDNDEFGNRFKED